MAVKQDINKFSKAIESSIKKVSSAKSLERFGKVLITIIQRRTRRGFGVQNELGNRRKLKPLKKSYIDKRKKSTLSRFTSAKKSNLTFTGQLLSSLKLIKKKNAILIRPTKTRRNSRLSNQAVAEYVSKTRPFLNISKVELKQITINFDKSMTEIVKRGLANL